MVVDVASLGVVGVPAGVGAVSGAVVGYAIKKVLKIAAVVIGLFMTGVMALYYKKIVNIDWTQLQTQSQQAVDYLYQQGSIMFGQVSNQVNSHVIGVSASNVGLGLGIGTFLMGFTWGFRKG